jgi:hypothetical protein
VFYFLKKKKIIIFYYIFRFLETKQEFFLKPIHVFIFLTNNNKMRKDDIIGQKLFETCKLSEFYLNLVVNCKEADNESPFQLARAYKQKLYEIVERYDRLLDANKQRQQLSLTFDKQQQQKISTRTSTPNKTPLATPTSATGSINGNNNTIIFNYHTPSAPCTPSTPTTPLFSRSSQSILQRTSSFNQTGRSFIYTHNSTKYQQNKSKQQHQQQQSQHSSLSKTSKLLQKYAFLYEDDYDSAEDENELLENNFYSKNKYNNNKKNTKKTIVSSSSSSLTGLQTAMLNCKLNYETYSNTFSKLNQTNSNDETVEEYNDEDEEDLDNEEDNDDEEEEEEYTNDLNESQIIEKSYSNLSKDSGVFADSYHSDYSTGLIGIGNHDQTVSSNLVKNGENNNKNNNNSNNNNIRRKKKKKTIKFNDTISTTSTTESNKTIDSTSEDYLEQIENKTINQQDEQQQQQQQKEQIGSNETTASNQLIWGSITQLVEGATFKDAKSLISSSPIESPKTLVKSNTVINNFEFNTNDDLVSIMNTDDNQAYSLNDSAKASTNSNCSTTTVMRHNISQDNERTNKELKFFNTNSLMNVSMLDNIQATNTHLDFDNMNTSILMFN